MKKIILITTAIVISVVTTVTAGCGKKNSDIEENTTGTAIEMQTKATALTTTVNEDKSKTEEMSDGSTVVIAADGKVTVTTSEGEVKEMTTEEYVVYKEEAAPQEPEITPPVEEKPVADVPPVTDNPPAEEEPQEPEITPPAEEKPVVDVPSVEEEPEIIPPVEEAPEEPAHGVKVGTVIVKINWYHIDGTVGFIDTQVCDIDAYGDIVGDPLYHGNWDQPDYNMDCDYIITSYGINDPTGENRMNTYIENEGASIKKYIDSNYEFNLYPRTMSRH